MKKHLIMMILIILGAAVFAQSPEWYVTSKEKGERVINNEIILKKGENYVYIYFKASGIDYEKILLDFTISSQSQVIWQAVYMSNVTLGSQKLAGRIDKGPIETDFKHFKLEWMGRGPVKSANITGICLKLRTV